jgi:hypothetical protein
MLRVATTDVEVSKIAHQYPAYDRGQRLPGRGGGMMKPEPR